MGGVVVRRSSFELGRARVDGLERPGKPVRPVALDGERSQLVEEPRIDRGSLADLFCVGTAPERLENQVEAIRRRGYQAIEEIVGVLGDLGRRIQLAGAHRLCHRLAEGAADGHHFANRFHVGGEAALGARELLEREPGHLRDHVVDRRLERGRGRLRDVVGDLLERVTHRELGGDLGDRKAGRLRGERRRARDPRIHLDHYDLTRRRVDRELDVRAARLHADRPDHTQCLVPKLLVEPIGERLGRRDGDAVSGMDAHRIDILDRADHHDVVVVIAHHLQLELAPAQHRLLHEHSG